MARFSILSKTQAHKRPEDTEQTLDEVISDIDAETAVGIPAASVADEVDTPARAEAHSTDEDAPSFDLLDAKLRVHNKLIDELDLSMLDKLDETEMMRQVRRLVTEIVRDERIPMNQAEVASFADSVYHEMTGLGPLEPLLADPTISDILINGYNQVYVERRGELELSSAKFRDNAHLRRIVSRIVSAVGRRVDESQPLVDARLLDGSRVNAAVEPVAIDGPLVSIRKFSKSPLTLEKLIEFKAMPKEVAEFLHGAVKCRVTAIISGGTGSGKTTLLNALSKAISHKERLITIEDAAELQLQQPHVARMETRPPNLEGKGEIRQRELVKNALRMRPDRVILGEVRSEEAFDMLQAMNTGHEGSMATIHANNPREAISRLEQMVAMGGLRISSEAVRGQIASAIGIIIQAQRLSDGSRRITHVTEVTGMEGDIIQMQDIFTFNRLSTSEDGTVVGEFRASGLRPKCLDEMNRRGVHLPLEYFDPSRPLLTVPK
ncbi:MULTISPECIES: CpaF family protein [Henriciella]|jgi:pilus assembly protein CpaF|uniref:CpaF pilus assembly protein, ATPase CpaF n=1 Tax=Henriciella pelagia TaxID=1977912 RepID=A0ABQ1IYQ8_9PROT|nr:CpaF family protein [Henriciella pelagia]GGB55792.1 CpaF pilus assembly protein, ATPase CpaF [Henriciella pelagia]